MLALDGSGGVTAFADYGQWEAARREKSATTVRPQAATAPAVSKAPKRLSWAEQREWEGMEGAILAAEEALTRSQSAAHDPAIATSAAELAARWREVQASQDAVDKLFARWAELEAKRGG